MSSQKKTSRLEGKDLITIGIYTVIYVVIVMLVAMLGFIPIFIPLMAVLCPLIGGIPYMLYVTKAKKFGMTAIMGFLIGLIMVFFGNGYLTMVTGLVGGLLADVILKKADYKSAKSTVLSCGVFSIWVFGNFAPIFLNRESYLVMLTEGYGAEYAATLNTYMPMWIAPILLVACFVFGIVGGLIGKAICKKHFQRAGIAYWRGKFFSAKKQKRVCGLIRVQSCCSSSSSVFLSWEGQAEKLWGYSALFFVPFQLCYCFFPNNLEKRLDTLLFLLLFMLFKSLSCRISQEY